MIRLGCACMPEPPSLLAGWLHAQQVAHARECILAPPSVAGAVPLLATRCVARSAFSAAVSAPAAGHGRAVLTMLSHC